MKACGLRRFGCLLLFVVSGLPFVQAAERGVAVPAPLAAWKDWVLHDVAHLGCPSPYNDAETRIAVWPKSLTVDVTATSGEWQLQLRAFGRSWLPLPGGVNAWPEAVQVDGNQTPVVARDGVPSIEVEPGTQLVTGRFNWRQLPEHLAVPAMIGIVTLSRDGVAVPLPERDASGRLWLERTRSSEQAQDQCSVQIARVLEDGLPLWLRTELELSVSGRSREEEIGCVLPAGWQLAAIEGPVPVAIDTSGQLRAQVRPGTWRIRIDAFRTSDTNSLRYPETTAAATADELIGLQLRPEFRVIEFENADPVDVAMTRFPDRWRSLPVFRWDTAAPLTWSVKNTGAGLRQPDRFQIQRHLWLDDDGAGITVEDQIAGECRELSRLDAATDQELAVVRIDGQRQLITTDPLTGSAGVELRSPRPSIEAIGRLRRTAVISAIGWQTAADNLRVSLSLPPGWRMLAVLGPDRVEGDWLTAWTLLDLFLLLVFALAVFRMRGAVPGAVALLAFGLAYHEAGAPRFTWLFLLVPVALAAVVHSTRAAWWIQAWKLLATGILLLHLVPYVTGEVQSAIYPQLEPRGIHYRQRSLSEVFAGRREPAAAGQIRFDANVAAPRSQITSGLGDAAKQQRERPTRQASRRLFETANMQNAPGTSTQTGIPRPAWDGNRIECFWDGPVTDAETIRPILLPAVGHRLLAVLRVVLLGILLGILVRPASPQRRGRGAAGVAVGVLALLAGLPAARAADRPAVNPSAGMQAERLPDTSPAAGTLLPAPEMLRELRERLLAPAAAFPHAAELPSARLVVVGNRVTFTAAVHAAVACAVPVPGKFPVWSPLTVTLDDAPAEAVLRREDGYLWVWVPRGISTIAVEGLIPDVPEWIWDFQLLPRRLELEAADWTVTGLDADGRPERQLFLARRQRGNGGVTGYDQTNLRSVVQIDRVLEMGLVWKLHTTVRRLSKPGRAITIAVPLLPGERVLTRGTNGSGEMLEVTLAGDTTAFDWESELPVTPEVRLEAAVNPQAVERWSLVTSPVWNVRTVGLGPVYEPDAENLVPVWYPWPGETVDLTFTRPQAVAGKTLTIQSITRASDLGLRRRTSTIDLQLESSLGGDFFVGLPEAATVRDISLDGSRRPVRRQANRVLVGLQPGRQQLSLSWTIDEPLTRRASFEAVELPVESANVSSELRLSESRWILWADGPLRGPAVRFWAVLALAVVLAAVLCRPHLSPLRFHEWLLLVIGLTQISVVGAVVVVGWLYLLAWRGQRDPQSLSWLSFDCLQIALVILTIAAVTNLVFVVSRGLLGAPEMFIAGNGSSGSRLIWFSPNESRLLGQPAVVSISIWYYRLLMLLWGLWLANAVIRWLVAGWRQFTAGATWRWWNRAGAA